MNTSVFVRNPFNYDTNAVSVATGVECLEPTLTQQQFAEDADINTIVRRFGITGQLPVNGRMPTYGDFSDVDDFHSAVNAVRAATEAFMALPGNVREEFGHDPQRLIDFCSNPDNLPAARKLGLAPEVPMPNVQHPPHPPAPPVDTGSYKGPSIPAQGQQFPTQLPTIPTP